MTENPAAENEAVTSEVTAGAPTNTSNKFSIGADVKAFNRKEFAHGIHNAYLVKVDMVTRKVQEEEKHCMEFSFQDADGRQYNHLEWPIDELDAKFDVKFKGLSERVNHMAATLCGGAPAAGTFSGDTMKAFFESIVGWFNIADEKGKHKWSDKPLWIKLVYSGKNLSFPLSPNFIDPVKIVGGAKKATTLTWNHKYDKSAPTGGGGFGGGESFTPFAGNPDELPPIEV